jgi:hypothetical protein
MSQLDAHPKYVNVNERQTKKRFLFSVKHAKAQKPEHTFSAELTIFRPKTGKEKLMKSESTKREVEQRNFEEVPTLTVQMLT